MARSGGATRWLATLQMAEAWGVPPWEIHHHPGSALWAGRWAAYKQELAEITKPKD